MPLLLRTDLNLFCFFVSAVILADLRRYGAERNAQSRIFRSMLLINMAALGLEILGWLVDGRPGRLYANANLAVNAVFYALTPLPAYLWVLYADYEVFRNERRTAALAKPLALPAGITALLSLATPFTGWMFSIQSGNLFCRGSMFPVLVALSYGYFMMGLLLVIRRRNNLPKTHLGPLLFYTLPPVLGGMVQALNYGLTLLWSGLTLSILNLYLSIQNKKMQTDYLTGTHNRLSITQMLKDKVRESSAGKGFSLVLIDLNGFKAINDQYGHAIGDEALAITAKLLKQSLRKDDFLARYGGDEFLIVLDIADAAILDKSVARIEETFRRFNAAGTKPYTLSLSIGYAVYDSVSQLTEEQFLQYVDALMYQEKHRGAVT